MAGLSVGSPIPTGATIGDAALKVGSAIPTGATIGSAPAPAARSDKPDPTKELIGPAKWAQEHPAIASAIPALALARPPAQVVQPALAPILPRTLPRSP